MIHIEGNFDTMLQVSGAVESGFDVAARMVQDWIGQIADDILLAQREPGLEIDYPVAWDSDRQRRAYFASGGFGFGIPYARRGIYEDGWKIDRSDNGYLVFNEDPAAHYITGTLSGVGGEISAVGGSTRMGGADTGQSRIHAGRWVLIRDTVASVLNKWMPTIQDLAVSIAKEVAAKVTQAGKKNG